MKKLYNKAADIFLKVIVVLTIALSFYTFFITDNNFFDRTINKLNTLELRIEAIEQKLDKP